MVSLLHWIMYILLQKHVLCTTTNYCGDLRNVTGAVGGDVTLAVDKNINIKDIIWINVSIIIATTFPDKTIDIRDLRLESKLHKTEDISLILSSLTLYDEAIYTASIRYMNSTTCSQVYNLRVYDKLKEEDIKIQLTVFQNETCNVNLTCDIDENRDLIITWKGSDIDRRSPASLYISNVTDHRYYTCTATNPISKASRSVSPWNYCSNGKRENNDSSSHQHIGLIIAPIVIVAVPIVIVFIFMQVCKKQKREIKTQKLEITDVKMEGQKKQGEPVNQQSAGTDVEDPKSQYTFVQSVPEQQKREEANGCVQKADINTQNFFSVYRQVQHTQDRGHRNNTLKKEDSNQTKQRDPNYEEVQTPEDSAEIPKADRCNPGKIVEPMYCLVEYPQKPNI